MSNELNTQNLLQEDQTCPATGYQEVTVCVPVTVTPFANAGSTTTFCCGDPIVTGNTTPCTGTVNGTCIFKITQNLCVAVPVEFGANATVGAPHVECGDVSSTDICTNCSETGAPATTTATTQNNTSTTQTCSSCKK